MTTRTFRDLLDRLVQEVDASRDPESDAAPPEEWTASDRSDPPPPWTEGSDSGSTAVD